MSNIIPGLRDMSGLTDAQIDKVIDVMMEAAEQDSDTLRLMAESHMAEAYRYGSTDADMTSMWTKEPFKRPRN